MSPLAAWVTLVHRVIFAISEHIGAQETGGVGGGVAVGVYEAAKLRVIVARLEIVEPRLGIVVITTVAQGIYLRERSAAAYYIAPRVVGVACDGAAAAVNDTNNVALCVEYVVVQRAVILHCQRLTALVIDEVNGLAAARLAGHESAEGRELVLRAVYGLAAANARHVVGIAYVRAADRRRRQSAPLRPCERAAVVIPRRVAAAVAAYLMPVIRREQVAPRAVAVGVSPIMLLRWVIFAYRSSEDNVMSNRKHKPQGQQNAEYH